MKSYGKYKVNIRNFNKVCRLCLSEYVFSKSRDIYQKKIREMIEYCSSIKINIKGDGLPSRLCSPCSQNLVRFYSFKRKIERIDKLLHKYSTNDTSQQDILDIALNKADISKDGQFSNTGSEGNTICENVVINEAFPLENDLTPSQDILYNSSTNSTEDSSLTLENHNTKDAQLIDSNFEATDRNTPWPRKTKDNAMKIINRIINDCETNEEVTHDSVTNTPNLMIEFPLSKIKLKSNSSIDAGPICLPGEPPPLIPIKPIPHETILSNMEIDNHSSLECPKCNEKFTSQNLLEKHTTVCSLSNSLICNICKKEFTERKKLIGHLKGHMVAKNYGCKICGKRYPNPSTFEIHMRTHTGERPFKCPVCSKGFTRWAGVVSHMQTHYDHRPYKCDTCNKSFKIVSNLERHKVLHSEIMPFCCNYCGKTFSQSDNLQLHIRSYHTNERPYLCSQCGKGFVSSTRLNRHMWVHTGHKPFRCSLCPKAYSNSSDLKNHERGAHGNGNSEKPFACSLCEMRFFHPCRLSKHLKTHQRPFACQHCNKSFSSSALLDKHTETLHSVTM